MEKITKQGILASIVITIYAFMFHAIQVTPHDYVAVVQWLPLYLAPIWVIVFWVIMSEKNKSRRKC